MKPGKDRHRLMIEHLRDAFAYHRIVLDDYGTPVDYIFIETNSAFEEMTGLKREEVIGKKVTEILPGIVKAEFDWIATYGKVALNGESIRFENFSAPLDRWYDVSAYSDQPGYFAAIFRDISESKKTVQDLLESEKRHSRVFETMAQGVIYQAAGGEITSVNPAAEKILGLTSEQMEGKTSMDTNWQMIEEDGSAVPGTEHPAMIALRTGQKVGPVIRGVYNPEAKAHIWMSITAIPLFQPGDDKPFQVYATIEDITERKKAEEALQKSETRFQRMLRVIPDMVSVHDPDMNIVHNSC